MERPKQIDYPSPRVQCTVRNAEGHWFLIIEKDIASKHKRFFWETTERFMALIGHPCCKGTWFWGLVIPDKAAKWLGDKFAYYAINAWEELFQFKISKERAKLVDPLFVEMSDYIDKIYGEDW